MTKVVLPQYTIRVWRQEELGVKVDHIELAGAVDCLADGCPTAEEAAEAILALERVNAVEVLDNDGHGTVLYKDWP